MMQYKILIVDDEPMLVRLLADYLGDLGYLPYTAYDSIQAMDKLLRPGGSWCIAAVRSEWLRCLWYFPLGGFCCAALRFTAGN